MENSTSPKLYSLAAIDLATFFGGPLAAGILFRRNAIALGKSDQGHWLLLIGLLSHLGIFGSLIVIDEAILDRIPNFLFPALYTVIIHLVGQKIHGAYLSHHKENNLPFFSRWKAVGIGGLVLLVTSIVFFAFVFVQEDPLQEKYLIYEQQFIKNEERSMPFYDHLQNSNDKELVDFILGTYMPAWQENLALTQTTRQSEEWNAEMDLHFENLEIYSEKRIEMAQAFLRSHKAGTDDFFGEMEFIQWEIDSLLREINP